MDLKLKCSYNRSQVGKFRSVEAQRVHDKVEATIGKVADYQETFTSLDGKNEDRNVLPGQVLVDGELSGFYDASTGELDAKTSRTVRWTGGGGQISTEAVSFSRSDQEKVWREENRRTSYNRGDNRTERTTVFEIREDLSTGVISVFENQ